MSKQNVKNVVLPHSEAKLQMYRGYLEKYIQILVAYQGWTKINLYDVFCGSGIYEDGKVGSPILAFEAIKMNRDWCTQTSKLPTPIQLNINDVDKGKVKQVEDFLQSQPKILNCSLKFSSKPSKDFLHEIETEVNKKITRTRNLIFIDPYGYKEVQAEVIKTLLSNNATEIILFLPVSFIYRFAGVAQVEVDVKQYEHLRNLISGFFKPDHPIQRNEVKSPSEFIRSLKEAMSFGGRFFSASYFIQRDKGNFFALFFMTSNLLGLEKFLETKWGIDPVKGQGYKMPNPLGPGLFDAEFNERDRDDRLQLFASSLEEFLKEKQQHDFDLYKFTLFNEFIPEHTVSILRKWQEKGLVEVFENENGKPARKNSFNINYDSTKPAGSKFTFKLKR